MSNYDSVTGLTYDRNEDRAIAEFYINAVQNNYKSEHENRPIFEDKLFIRIRVPGDRHTEVDRPAKDADKWRFPLQWARFEKEEAQSEIGTPLEAWPAMTPALVKNFKALNIANVEALADVSDGNLQNIGIGARVWRDKAKAYLEDAEKGAASSRLLAENQDLRDQIATANANMADMQAAIRRLEAKHEG